MATLKKYYKKGNKRADETWNIVIGFTHNGKVSFMPTTTYVPPKKTWHDILKLKMLLSLTSVMTGLKYIGN